MVGGDRSRLRDFVLEVTAAAATAPAVIAFTVLGASVLVGRGLLRVTSSLLPLSGADAPTPRHHTARVRQRATAAAEAARASGLLKHDH
jgi:hypothetical protein